MSNPKLTAAEMASELGINPNTTLVLTNEPSSQKAKQGDGMENARTQVTMQTFLRNINMLSPKDGKPIVKFKSSPRRVERHLTPEKCRGRELGIILELQTERDVDRLVTTWKKASKKGERRQLIRWPIEKNVAPSSSGLIPTKLQTGKDAASLESSEDEDDE